MYTIEYEFYPGETAYVVVNQNTVRQGKILQVDAKIYEREEAFVEELKYLVLLVNDMTTARVEVEDIFATVDEALDKVREKFNETDQDKN